MMSNFKKKFKKPEKIQKFDDSDLSEWRDSTESSPRSTESVNSRAVLPRSVPNHLLFISILEQLCNMYSRDHKQAQEIFKTICEQLTNLKVVSPLLMLDEMSSLRGQYRHSVHRMLLAAVHKSNKSTPSRLSLPAPNGYLDVPALPSSIPQGPAPAPHGCDNLINQTSRYSTEFVELEKIGKGGFGSVYKSRNKLDGKLYAIKEVKFKHSKPENIFRVLREVKALANLQHTNIVGYNSCWLEYGSSKVVRTSNVSQKDAAYGLKADGDSLSASDDVIFVSPDASPAVDLVQQLKEGLLIRSGPKIKEISSNCSSLASSPQSNNAAASPPKPLALYRDINKPNTDTSMLKYSNQLNPFMKETRYEQFTMDSVSQSADHLTVESHNTQTWSTLPDDHTRDPDSAPHCKFMLSPESSTDDSMEVDGGSFDSKRTHNKHRVYKKSISCDPMASGEVMLSYEQHQKDQAFTESDFPLKKSVTLYIQMELCRHTLKEWMQHRNENCKTDADFMAKCAERNMWIFKQILKAVDYMHGQGVMHRDLKPRNIFLTENEQCVKVGDFGLATEDIMSPVYNESFQDLESLSTRLVRTASVLSDHTTGVGTSTYAAPEQLQSSIYDAKCDVYSLGMILFELFQKYSTEMERSNSLSNLRNSIIPDIMRKKWPMESKYIKLMTSEKPDVRPSVKAMLTGELFLSKDQIIEDLRQRECQYRAQVELLTKENEEKDRTIKKLMAELSDTSFLSTSSPKLP